MDRHLNILSPAVVLLLLCMIAQYTVRVEAQVPLVKPDQWLAMQPKPNFAKGHQLRHLTRWGWQLSSNTCVELAKNWGYTLDLNWADEKLLARLQNPNSMESGFIKLAKQNPEQFELSVLISRTFPKPIPNGFYCTNALGLFVDSKTNTWADPADSRYIKVISPEGPDDYWATAAEYQVSFLRAIRSNAPIAIVLNGGEYGLDVAGFGAAAWSKDPRVQAATNGLSWPAYSSIRKAHQLSFVTSAVRKALPDRELYIFYNTGDEQNRNTYFKDWFNGVAAWGWSSDLMVSNTDLPSFENYFEGTWTTIKNPLPNDILTRYLNAVGYNLKLGCPTNYSWVNGGWGTNASKLSDISRYSGFLKCLYTAGMVGGVAGYFDFPPGGFDVPFPSNAPPHWLRQIAALGYIHALFSHFDNFITDGDLISGPQPHGMSKDQPAYEFTNRMSDTTVRVLCRKLRAKDQWLITAWASDGPDRSVTVEIPTLGSVTLVARSCGTLYEATQANLTLIDNNGLFPSPAPPLHLQRR